MKTCFKCRRHLTLSEFYAHPRMADGRLNKCKDCAKQDVAANYRKKRERYRRYERRRELRPERKRAKAEYQRNYRKRNPERYAARAAVATALRDGRLERSPCAECGDPKSEAHHEDYGKPLEVAWLCFRCHRRRHGQQA